MRVYTDDDLRRIDRTWLGPPNKRLPWVATYRQYVTIIVVGLTLFAVMLFLGFPMTELAFQFVWFLLTYFSVKAFNAYYRDDVGILVNGITAYQELSVPREDADAGYSHVLSLHTTRYSPDQCRQLDRTGRAIVAQRVSASRARGFMDRRRQR